MVSKTDAGRLAILKFPRHVRVLEEALRLRHGKQPMGDYSRLSRRRDLISFMDAVIDSARHV